MIDFKKVLAKYDEHKDEMPKAIVIPWAMISAGKSVGGNTITNKMVKEAAEKEGWTTQMLEEMAAYVAIKKEKK